jgi:hypothetical protein
MGKVSMALFRLKGWTNDTVISLKVLNSSFFLTPAQTSKPSMDALQIRTRADQVGVKTAVFRAVSNPPALDGSATGWDTADQNISLWADGSHSVAAQLVYDADHLYIRATMRMRQPLPAIKLYPDWQRMFTHGVGGTTLSLYLQGNVSYGKDCDYNGQKICNTGGQVCNPGSWNVSEGCAHCYCHSQNCHNNNNCRDTSPSPGAARIVLGVFDTADSDNDSGSDTETQLAAVALGMYPDWPNGQSYVFGTRTTGTQSFDNVQLLNATSAGLGVKTGFALDAAKTTLILAASLPRAVFPSLPSLSGGGVATGFDLSSTMSGHNKFWWEVSSASNLARPIFWEPLLTTEPCRTGTSRAPPSRTTRATSPSCT